MGYKQWLEIFSTISADNNLNESNVIGEIKKKLKAIDLDTYKEWKRTGFKVNKNFAKGNTLLHLATQSGNTYVINALLEANANVNAKDAYGYTPLHWAAQNGHTAIVNTLVAAGVNVEDIHGRTPLRLAVQSGHTDAINALLEAKANVNTKDAYGYTPLHSAAQNGHTEIIKVLIKNGADVYQRVDVYKNEDEYRYGYGCSEMTLLHLAAQNDHTETVKALIKEGIEVNTVNGNGYTPLHLAVESGRTEMVEALIDGGAKVNAMDALRCTPLHMAVKMGKTEIIKVLIKNGADVNTENGNECTLLHIAVENGSTEIIKALIDGGAKVNAMNALRCTPLHTAVKGGKTEIIKVLIKNGADVNAANESGCTPLDYAVKNSNIEMANALIERGADPLLGNKSYRTPKCLIKLIKNNSSEHQRKAEETQQREEQADDEYEFFKYLLPFYNNRTLIDNIRGGTFDNLLCIRFAETSTLTLKQKELNKKLLSVLKDLSYLSDESCHGEGILRNFLQENKNDDLKTILNLKRGESRSTILHVLSNMDSKLAEKYVNLLLGAGADPNAEDDRGKTPLHYASYVNIESLIKAGADLNKQDSEKKTPLHCAASIGDEKSVNALLEHGADHSKKNKQGKTPLQAAIDNHRYHVERYFLTDDQKMLWRELVHIVNTTSEIFNTDFTKLEGFLSEYKNNPDFERILNLRDYKGESEILLLTRVPYYLTNPCYKKVEGLLLKAGAIDYKRLDRKEHLLKFETLGDNLIFNQQQQQQLKKALDVVGKAQDMNQLEKIVNEGVP